MKSKPAKKPRSGKSRGSSNGMRWKSRLLDGAILVSTVIVGIFVFSVVGRLSSSHAERNERPPRVLQTQILNGCGVVGLAADFAEELMHSRVEEFRFDVVDRDNFDDFEVENSFITVYTLPVDDALRLGSALGLSADDVFIAEDTDNIRGLDVTIVLGGKTKPTITTAGETSPVPAELK